MKNRMLALLAAGLFLLNGCSSSGTESIEPDETLVVYQALPLPEIYLDIPERFETTSSQYYEEYYIFEDASIIVTEDTNGPFFSAYEYSIGALVQYQEIAHTLEVVSQEMLSGKNCDVQLLEFNYTLGEDDSIRMSCMTGFIADGNSMYLITCKSNTGTYEEYREDFLYVLRSAMITRTGK